MKVFGEKRLKRDRGIAIFRPFYKKDIINPCSLCVLRDHEYKAKYGEDGCSAKGVHLLSGTIYSKVCRGFDTDKFYYIPRRFIFYAN